MDVAVCVKSDKEGGCNNRILGYYFWSWIIDDKGVGQKFITAPAWKDLDTEFQSAVAAWNKWAPTLRPCRRWLDGANIRDPCLPVPDIVRSIRRSS